MVEKSFRDACQTLSPPTFPALQTRPSKKKWNPSKVKERRIISSLCSKEMIVCSSIPGGHFVLHGLTVSMRTRDVQLANQTIVSFASLSRKKALVVLISIKRDFVKMNLQNLGGIPRDHGDLSLQISLILCHQCVTLLLF